MACSSNLKQIALALHDYHDTHGEFPPACIADEQGRPMHSWRILILPFVEQQVLFDEYRFDEPWNGPRNRLLAHRMPTVFRCPSYAHHKKHDDEWVDDEKVLTQYVALVGTETIFPPGRSVRMDEITDGLPNTLLVAELHRKCVHWMAPTDADPGDFATALLEKRGKRKNHPGGTHIMLADGSVRFVAETFEHESLRSLFTIDGGEPY